MGRKTATLHDLPLMFLFRNNGYIESENRHCAEHCRDNNTHTVTPFLRMQGHCRSLYPFLDMAVVVSGIEAYANQFFCFPPYHRADSNGTP